MGSIKGNTEPKVLLGTTDVGAYVNNIAFVEGDGEPPTFAARAAGYAPVALEIEFLLDFAATGAFEYLWANAGSTAVSYEVKFDTNAATSQTNPRFSGTLTMPNKPLPGMENSGEDQYFSATFALDSYEKSIS